MLSYCARQKWPAVNNDLLLGISTRQPLTTGQHFCQVTKSFVIVLIHNKIHTIKCDLSVDVHLCNYWHAPYQKRFSKPWKQVWKFATWWVDLKRKQIRKCRFMFCELVCSRMTPTCRPFICHARVMRTDRFKYCTASKVVQTDLVLNTK